MASVESLAEIAMQIISYAGAAKSNYMMALSDLKLGNSEGYNIKMKEGDSNFIQAHEAHKGALTEEMQTLEPNISLLLAHAEDQLMHSETVKLFVSELAELYNKGISK